jgi:hypothetical protein
MMPVLLRRRGIKIGPILNPRRRKKEHASKQQLQCKQLFVVETHLDLQAQACASVSQNSFSCVSKCEPCQELSPRSRTA